MYVLFFLVWLIFNGQITLEIIIFGLVIAAFVYAFVCKFLSWNPQKDLFIFRKSGQIAAYAGLLILEIIKANMATIRMIVSFRSRQEPVIIHFRTKLESRAARVLLANSITLTPGTITAALQGDELVVHCLDRSFAQGLCDSSFEKALLKLEAGFDTLGNGKKGGEK